MVGCPGVLPFGRARRAADDVERERGAVDLHPHDGVAVQLESAVALHELEVAQGARQRRARGRRVEGGWSEEIVGHGGVILRELEALGTGGISIIARLTTA